MSGITIHAFRRLIAPLANRVRLIVSRGVVGLVDDSFKMQALQVELHEEEIHDGVERFEDYGITSHPFKDAEVLYLSVGGNRSAGVVVRVADRRHRPKDMAEGDMCLYTDKGERVYLNRLDDIVHLGAKSAADFVALAAKTDSRLDALESFAGSHDHPAGGTLLDSMSGTVTGKTGAASGAPSGTSTAATKVKAT